MEIFTWSATFRPFAFPSPQDSRETTAMSEVARDPPSLYDLAVYVGILSYETATQRVKSTHDVSFANSNVEYGMTETWQVQCLYHIPWPLRNRQHRRKYPHLFTDTTITQSMTHTHAKWFLWIECRQRHDHERPKWQHLTILWLHCTTSVEIMHLELSTPIHSSTTPSHEMSRLFPTAF